MYDREVLPITAIVLTLNEESVIEATLESVSRFAGQIVVVDSGSEDETVEKARPFVDEIRFRRFRNYSDQRNWAQAIESIENEWVFHIDAGEVVTKDLADELINDFSTLRIDNDGFLIRRRTMFWGRWMRYGGLYPNWHCRLFRRIRGKCEERVYDQHYIVDGRTAKLEGHLDDQVARSLSDWTNRHDRWAEKAAMERNAHGGTVKTTRSTVTPSLFGTPIQRRRWLRINIYLRLPRFIRGWLYFMYRYIIRLGFLDGKEGFVYHFLHGLWYRIYVDAKEVEIIRSDS